MKSLLVTVFWPAWEWLQAPETRWLFASYSESLATDHSVNRRQLLQSPWYRDGWGDRFQLTSDQNEKTQYRNSRRGIMTATSIGGTATGKGGNRIIVDDPHNPVQADGIESSPSFVREPEGNGVAERFIRTLKENLLWVRSFDTIEALRLALLEFKRMYNEQWMLEKYHYRSPAQVRRDLVGLVKAA